MFDQWLEWFFGGVVAGRLGAGLAFGWWGGGGGSLGGFVGGASLFLMFTHY
jgi:hypothetical protein